MNEPTPLQKLVEPFSSQNLEPPPIRSYSPPAYGSEESFGDRGVVQANHRPSGKPFAFALAHGESGASIWWGQLAACICTVTVTREDGKITTITQDPIPKTTFHAPSNLDTDTRLQTHLGWYGDVYLYWEANDNGEITTIDVRGPDEPTGEDIGELDANLNRTVPINATFCLALQAFA